MNLIESIVSALTSLRANLFRSILTLLSIAIGIFAIIGAGVASTSLTDSVIGALDEVGGNAFVIKRTPSIQLGNEWRKYAKRKPISYEQSQQYKQQIGSTANVSIMDDSPGVTVKYNGQATDPDVTLYGIDENYFFIRSKTIASGRPILPEDLLTSRAVCVLGNDIVVKLFGTIDPLGKTISVRGSSYDVVGVLAPKGAVLGQSQDNEVFIPMPNYIQTYTSDFYFSGTITVKTSQQEDFADVFEESIGLMRALRNCKPGEDNDFEIEDNATIVEQFKMFLGFLGVFGYLSGGFALVAAAVGITNIMLISVKERTREIGVRKAIGATKMSILLQFIIEAITLCQVGCFLGIIFGIIAGVLITTFAEWKVTFPMTIIASSVVLCTVIGILSGLYPAWRAASLDPIDALRYE